MQQIRYTFRFMQSNHMANFFCRFQRYAVGVVFLLCNSLTQASPSPVTVRLISQYDYPPFQTAPKEGLTFALAEYLTAESNGAYRFVAEVLPRKRLDVYIADSSGLWVVPWAIPRFFGADSLSKYEWTKPFMQDGNHLVTLRKSGIQYKGPDSLAGLRLGGTSGHRYALLEPLIQEGRLSREDCANLVCNLEKLKLDRVDVVWFPSGAVPYFRELRPDFDELFYVSPQPMETFERSFMVPKGQPELLNYLNTIIKKLSADPKWKLLLSPSAIAVKTTK
jgi:polar amino acid transport system substrate-binding protein